MNSSPTRKASIIEYKKAFEAYIPKNTSPNTLEILGKSVSCALILVAGLATRKLAVRSILRLNPTVLQTGSFIGGCCIAKKTQDIISNQMSSYVIEKNSSQLERLFQQEKLSHNSPVHIIPSTLFNIEKFYLNMPKEHKFQLQENESRIKKAYEENNLQDFIHSPFPGVCSGQAYSIIKQLLFTPNINTKQLSYFLNSPEGKMNSFLFQTFLGATPIPSAFSTDLECEKIVRTQINATIGISPDQVHFYVPNERNVYPSVLSESSVYALIKHFNGKYLVIGLRDESGGGHAVFLHSSDETGKHYFYDSLVGFFSCSNKETLTHGVLLNFKVVNSVLPKIQYITVVDSVLNHSQK